MGLKWTLPLIGFSALAGLTHGMPPWVESHKTTLTNQRLKIACSGTGPSYDIAKRESLDNCLANAVLYIRNNVRVLSVTIETERDVAYHQEIESDERYKNLKCSPDKEQTTQREDEFTVWVLCEFDLSKLNVTQNLQNEVEKEPQHSLVSNKKELGLVKARTPASTENLVVSQDHVVLSISSVPTCDTLLIQGENPRVIQCQENPFPLLIKPGDKSVLVRKHGYLPKTIDLNTEKMLPSDVTVILDRTQGGIQ